MAIKVSVADDADALRCFEIASLAFARNEPFFDLVYPEHWTEAGRAVGAQRYSKAINGGEPQPTTLLKAVDEATGQIVGMAKWNIWDHCLPDLDATPEIPDYWPTQDDKELCLAVIGTFTATRNDAVRASTGNLVGLDVLAIDPAHQRRGIGGALVKWGIDLADKMDVETIVESSVYGKGLYEKNGFVFIKNVALSVPEKWQSTHKHLDGGSVAWLVRPKKSDV